jgi:hypothetical protein
MKDIIVELDDTGLITGVYCPDENYYVHILEAGMRMAGSELREYYNDLEKIKDNLHNCY